MTQAELTASSCDDIARPIRLIIERTAPDLIELFDEYAGEMRFGRSLIDKNIQPLKPGAAILEVGAGSLLLSCCLQKEGFNVTALEPIGSGFSHFSRMQAIVLMYAEQQNIAPTVLRSEGERLSIEAGFDFAFSINVMEHVADISTVLRRVHRALRPGGKYRFVCPNYAFPYEPHFNLPTLISRTLTRIVLWRWIRNSTNVVDPLGTWQSLNWITVRRVGRICRRADLPTPRFDRTVFDIFVQRAFLDRGFQERRGRVLVALMGLLKRMRFLTLTRFIPVAILPVMDCSIARDKE
ncbi:class I SAM-dependent methyltransferase [Paraburkholderia madseniana]|uniref:class I SAM-dependent methyltransferase n=1 Tax=Paraburkholderia madseniana TaxID=2599607 RepID=UPI0038B9A8EC